jgi:hypothetical protein
MFVESKQRNAKCRNFMYFFKSQAASQSQIVSDKSVEKHTRFFQLEDGTML